MKNKIVGIAIAFALATKSTFAYASLPKDDFKPNGYDILFADEQRLDDLAKQIPDEGEDELGSATIDDADLFESYYDPFDFGNQSSAETIAKLKQDPITDEAIQYFKSAYVAYKINGIAGLNDELTKNLDENPLTNNNDLNLEPHYGFCTLVAILGDNKKDPRINGLAGLCDLNLMLQPIENFNHESIEEIDIAGQLISNIMIQRVRIAIDRNSCLAQDPLYTNQQTDLDFEKQEPELKQYVPAILKFYPDFLDATKEYILNTETTRTPQNWPCLNGEQKPGNPIPAPEFVLMQTNQVIKAFTP